MNFHTNSIQWLSSNDIIRMLGFLGCFGNLGDIVTKNYINLNTCSWTWWTLAVMVFGMYIGWIVLSIIFLRSTVFSQLLKFLSNSLLLNTKNTYSIDHTWCSLVDFSSDHSMMNSQLSGQHAKVSRYKLVVFEYVSSTI